MYVTGTIITFLLHAFLRHSVLASFYKFKQTSKVISEGGVFPQVLSFNHVLMEFGS